MSERPRWRPLLPWKRPLLTTEALALAASFGLAVGANGAFWRAFLAGREPSSPETLGLAAGSFVLLVAVNLLLVLPLLWPRGARPVLALLLLASAAAAAFVDRFGIYLDPPMMRNVFETDAAEVAELLSPAVLGQVAAYAVLPLALLAWVRVRPEPWAPVARRKLAVAATALLVAVGAAWANLGAYTSHFTDHKSDRYLLTPGNVLVSSLRVAVDGLAKGSDELRVVGADARPSQGLAPSARPVLFVLVVGEAARAANFSLGGYERETNPELVGLDAVWFGDVEACGTATAASVPCMFSPLTRLEGGDDKGRDSESLLDVLARSGLRVAWRDNNSGCKGVCDRVEHGAFQPSLTPDLCGSHGCLDEVLLSALEEPLGPDHRFLVLHALGSHGPAYFRRVPERFAVFQPACRSADLHGCTPEEIRNAYDNTIRYTDHVLAAIVHRLAELQDRYDTAFLYVSDHGESLGENGLYLHGLPFAIAPDTQRKVPMIFWASAGFAERFGLDLGGLRRAGDRPYRHDHLFHSLLGVFRVETSAYDPELDLFADHMRGQDPVLAAEPARERTPSTGGVTVRSVSR